METKTHYRKAFNSPYLSSADIVGATNLTISRVVLELDKTKKTKDFFNTAYFQEKEIRAGEPLKPMILNAHNSRVLRDLCGSHFIEDWAGQPITVYVDQNVKFGRETVEGLRISPQPPIQQKPILRAGTDHYVRAVEALRRDGNLDAVKRHMEIPHDIESQIHSDAGL